MVSMNINKSDFPKKKKKEMNELIYTVCLKKRKDLKKKGSIKIFYVQIVIYKVRRFIMTGSQMTPKSCD